MNRTTRYNGRPLHDLGPPRMLDVARWVADFRFVEAFPAEEAAVAVAAGAALVVGTIAAQCQAVVDAELEAGADDVGLGHAQQRRVDAEMAAALDARLGRQVREPLELGEILRPAVGIAGV